MGTRPPFRTAKVFGRYVGPNAIHGLLQNPFTTTTEKTCVCALANNSTTASVDPKDPNADLHALLGITDK